MRKSYLPTVLARTFNAILVLSLSIFSAYAEPADGHDYLVKSGDGLYKLGRQFYGNGGGI